MADRLVTLRGGRQAGVQGRGDPVSQRIVLFCHPAPGSGGFDPDPRITAEWGVHLIGMDRPGYGASPPLPDDEWPTITDRADDLAEYLGVIRAEAKAAGLPGPRHVGVVGWSAGGRVALALASAYPDLVDRVAVVATPAPQSAVPWMPSEYTEAVPRLLTLPAAEAKHGLRSMLSSQMPEDGETPDPQLVGASSADAAVLQQPGVRGRLERMLQDAYTQGPVGAADDMLSHASDDWGFDLRSVRARTLLVYGAKDAVVPPAHGKWYRHRIHGAKLQVVRDVGHLVVVAAWQDVLAHVAPDRGQSGADGPGGH
ncbi:alpha/beta fold hydrolase [uncultured Amnibacterium sp.]|uniref:alpha/beta fold hydrolase n=1 Tax=uncultured Amnibacterium sp. TaxID=1631851 RepID=UPI0035CBFA77